MIVPTITVIIPTKGRDTLTRTIQSILPQMEKYDQILLVWDADNKRPYLAPEVPEDDRITEIYCKTPEDTPKPWVGQPQRNFALDSGEATRDLLVWMGDDDIMTDGALAAVRACAARNPGRVILARMRGWWGTIVWDHAMTPKERFQEGWLGDHNIIAPRVPEKLGRFGLEYTGDWKFVRETVDNFGGLERVVWLDKIIAVLRPGAQLPK